ncbi:Pkinase-domain-containing protein, partial [Hesseltinella vesiculosa]
MEVVEDERRPSVSSTTSKCPTCSTCSSFVDGHEQLGAYQLTKELSDGEFGQIRLGIHSQTREKVAIKLIRKDSDITTSKMDKIQLEIDVLKALDHPHIVKLYDVIETDSRLGLVLEYAAGGELFDYVISQHRVSEQDAKILFVQLIDSVKAMHQIGIVHRDLKLENILFKDVEQTHLLVSDFGFANKGKDLFKTSCGSPCYAAPELVLAPGNYDGRAADIWSCGVILYCMLCGCLPFDDDPDNPDSSNIRQLYHYIQTHPLIFPDQL